MKYKYLIILVFVFLLSSCAPEKIQEVSFSEKETILFEEYIIPSEFFPRTLELVGLGDSLTQGVGDELKRNGYVGRLKNQILEYKGIEDVVLTNTAKRGRRSDQLLKLLRDGEIDHQIRKADLITITIGGNDVMKVFKKDLFNLQIEAFEKELQRFERNYDDILEEIREVNSSAPILMIGIYNPITIVTDETSEVDQIITDWNDTIESLSYSNTNACFAPIDTLFDSNANLVYHTDFFHPNSKGYELIVENVVNSLENCGLIDEQSRELFF
ncbi:GDSL family lipase [Psychrobacillus sp. Sa2BUA9]|uniref:GDSL family lipase n=1 Tax=Psychrobacillus faecigallinarum TaxID=2762235 RepID=A0ABR8R947_9BACI|nr:GDSL-type esterase/lipase family protein [Psychrobacillus faecigallinarum]MBD7944336.1 GDSL family lipase [Psychrobacillus faecigallinarum]